MAVAIIGTGRWGMNLVKTLYQLGVLMGVADQSELICAKLQREYADVKVSTNYSIFLTNSNVKAVVIATPAPTHYRIAKEALLAGKDVFIEKPMTLAATEAEELAALAEQEAKVLMVGHLLLYQSAVQWIKAYLDSGVLGKINSLHQERLSLGRARETENVLWDLGVHDLAVILYLTGVRPVSSQITGHQRLREGVEDDIYLHLVFENNVQAHLHTSWLWPKRRRQLTITGAKGMLVYNEIEQTVMLYRNGINKSDLSNWDEGAELVFKGDGAPLTREMKHFLDCVEKRKTPISDGQSGADVVKIMEIVTSQLRLCEFAELGVANAVAEMGQKLQPNLEVGHFVRFIRNTQREIDR